jgi:PilZ domain
MEDRRRMPRVPFVATCELLEVRTGIRLNAQVSELSLHGCFVETVHPLAKNTEVYVKVFSDEYFFESAARVVYCHEDIGMGLEFHDVKPHFLGVLQNWMVAPAKRERS